MRRAALAVPVAAALLAGCADPRALEREARVMVYEQLSTPDAPVTVGPAVVRANYAMVAWTRTGPSGGRALLKRQGSKWTFALCGGAPMAKPETLAAAGVPEAEAKKLVNKLLLEEGRVDQRRRDQIERWQGLGAGVDCPAPKAG